MIFRSRLPLLTVIPVVHVLSDGVFGFAVARLNLAFELFTVAFDFGELVACDDVTMALGDKFEPTHVILFGGNRTATDLR